MKSNFIISVAALALAACGSGDTSAPPEETADVVTAPADTMAQPAGPAGTPAMPTDAAGYIAKAGAGDLWEIESSKALLAKSGNADVEKFAQMMIDQHGQSTAKVRAAATT